MYQSRTLALNQLESGKEIDAAIGGADHTEKPNSSSKCECNVTTAGPNEVDLEAFFNELSSIVTKLTVSTAAAISSVTLISPDTYLRKPMILSSSNQMLS